MYAINNVSETWFKRFAGALLSHKYDVPNPNCEQVTKLYWEYSHAPETAAEILIESL